MTHKNNARQLRDMTNAQLIAHVTKKDAPTREEVELLLRLESYVSVYGDFWDGV